jgi:peptidylprolyl isomerase
MSLTKPTVEVPAGPPPADLQIDDIVVGDGPEAVPGKAVKVHYVGVSHASGREFDSSWSRNDTFAFPLGAGHVIKGWDQGVAGMRVGGRRRLTIPSHLAYGERGAGGAIKPGETLVFVVDLVAIG